MAAIWGCVDLGGGTLPHEMKDVMERPFHACKIDSISSWSGGNVLMGGGVQYITAESVNERLPVIQEEKGVYFTADCYIDNRDDLIAELCPGDDKIPDGGLLFLAYEKWGEDASRHVYGCYAYAAYDAAANRLIVSADHVFGRCVFYARQGSRVYFSTLMEPIIQAMEKRPPLCREWIAGYLCSTTLASIDDPEITVYEGVRKVPAAKYIRFTPEGAEAVAFWSLRDVKPLRLANDDEYAKRLRGLMETAARQATRTSGEVGILLSGGMDSTAVATFAAPLLEEREKLLYSFTSVPIPGFVSTERYRSADESELVKLFCEMYPNIRPTFGSFPEEDALSIGDEFIRNAETPLKTSVNAVWIQGFQHMARKMGCRIMLTGQSGNLTISAGSLFTCSYSMLLRGRFATAWNMLGSFAKRRRIPRRRVFTSFATELIPGGLRRLPVRDFLADSLADKKFAAEAGYKRRDKRLISNTGIYSQMAYKQENELRFFPLQFSHLGEIETKHGLHTGMLMRDITRDIRIIEYCMSLPSSCYVDRNGVDRRLVRAYFRDRYPPRLLDEREKRGVQGTDWAARLARRWDTLYPQIVERCTSRRLAGYVDGEKTRALLDQLRPPPDYSGNSLLIQIMAVYFFDLFLEIEENGR